jgi:hypothetical protein
MKQTKTVKSFMQGNRLQLVQNCKSMFIQSDGLDVYRTLKVKSHERTNERVYQDRKRL